MKHIVFVTQEAFLFFQQRRVFVNWLFMIPYQNPNTVGRMFLENTYTT